MKDSAGVQCFLTDHLGSVVATLDGAGTLTSQQRYLPFGEARLTIGTLYTDRLFTGQREMAGLGVYHYGARFYSPYLNQFTQPDSTPPLRRQQFGKEKSHLAMTFLCPHGDSNSISPAETTVWRKERTTFFKMALCAPMGIRTPVWALRGPRPGPLDDGGVLYLFPFLESVRDCIIPILNRQRERHARHRVHARRWYVTFRCRRCATDR